MKERLIELLNQIPFGPLNGILIVAIEQNVSAPLASEELARQGAGVIKLEQASGDPSRVYLSKANFTSLNAAKWSVVLDKNETEFYADILALADVIIDNRSPEAKEKDIVLQKFLKSNIKHPVIFCSIVGYDSKDNKHLRALDVMLQGTTGMAATNGPNPDFPLKVGFVVIDITTAFKAASHIATHLFYLKNHPEIKNLVIHLEISMAKVSAQLQAGQYLKYLTEGKETYRQGNQDIFLSPFSFYDTKDGTISLAVVDENQFKKLCLHVLKREDFLKKYPTNKVRLESEIFNKELSVVLAKNTSEYWIKACEQQNIPCGKVNSIREAMQEPFAASFFTRTADNTPVIADVYLSSLFKEPQLTGAPNLNEHCEIIKYLISYQKENDLIDFASLQRTLQHHSPVNQQLPKIPASGFWQNPISEDNEGMPYQPNNVMRAKL